MFFNYRELLLTRQKARLLRHMFLAKKGKWMEDREYWDLISEIEKAENQMSQAQRKYWWNLCKRCDRMFASL